MHSIIMDITGYSWDFGGRPGLESNGMGLPVLLGGIDGTTVTERSYEPGVGTVFIQERLAQSAAWHVARHDLDPDRSGDALMLKYVTLDDTPTRNPKAFEDQIRSLYLQATGYPLAEEAAEVRFSTLWRRPPVEGSSEAAWAGVISAVLRTSRPDLLRPRSPSCPEALRTLQPACAACHAGTCSPTQQRQVPSPSRLVTADALARGERVHLLLRKRKLGHHVRVRSPPRQQPDRHGHGDPPAPSATSPAGGEDRPNVMRYFSAGPADGVVNGMDAHTVGHDSGRMMTMTGTSARTTRTGRRSSPLPLATTASPRGVQRPEHGGHLSGSVVRAGGGTLDLIDGSIVGASDAQPQAGHPIRQDRCLRLRAGIPVRGQQGRAQGTGRERSAALLDNLDRAMEIEGRRFEAGLDDLGNSLLDQAVKASELMRLGLSRTAMISIPGAWDCHGGVEVNAPQFESFFGALDALMDHLAITPGQSTRWLIDEVVVVALSEFGRTPLWNGAGGKDHWPFTSALVAGSGVRGGRTYGGTDDGLIGLKTDFRSGSPSDTGDMLGTENLGVALLKLGGVDPGRFLPGIQSFDAILRG